MFGISRATQRSLLWLYQYKPSNTSPAHLWKILSVRWETGAPQWSFLLPAASPCQGPAWLSWWTAAFSSRALEMRRTHLRRDRMACLPRWYGNFSEPPQAQLFCSLEEPAWEDWGAWGRPAPGRFCRAGGNNLSSQVLFTPNLWVWLYCSFVSLQPYMAKCMVFISGWLVFSQKNNAAVSQSKVRSRWQCSDHVMNRTNYFPEVLAFRGWTFFCAGGQRGVSGRHHCLQPGNIPQLALGNQPKNLVFDRDDLYGRDSLGTIQKSSLPRWASEAEHSLYHHARAVKAA